MARLTELAPDCCPVVAYGALLPQRVLDIPPHGWVNLHFSLLPAWRGAAPVQHAILAGDQVTGATTFRIVLELDAGPTFATVTEPIGGTDTAGDLLHRLSVSGADLLVQTLDGIEDGTLTPSRSRRRDQLRRQDQRRGRQDRLDRAGRRDRPADPRLRLPAPGAWTTFGGRALQDQLGPDRRPAPAAGCAGDHQADRRRSAPAPSAASSARCRPRARSRCPPPTGRAGSPSARSGSWHVVPAALRGRGPAVQLRRPRQPPDRARRVAFDALRRVTGDGAYANLVAAELLAERRLDSRDAAFATELLAGTCRWPGHLRPDHRGGRRSQARRASSRPCSTCSGWGPTRSWPCGCRPRPPSRPPSTWPRPRWGSGSPAWSTPCCGGWPPRT